MNCSRCGHELSENDRMGPNASVCRNCGKVNRKAASVDQETDAPPASKRRRALRRDFLRRVLPAGLFLTVIAGVGGWRWIQQAAEQRRSARRIELAVVATTDGPLTVSMDGQQLAAVDRRSNVIFYEIDDGLHELDIARGGETLIKDTRTFSPQRTCIAYCGGQWLRYCEIEYSDFPSFATSPRLVELPKTFSIQVDGGLREIKIEDQSGLDFYGELIAETDNFITVPQLLEFAADLVVLPGQEIPEGVAVARGTGPGWTRSVRYVIRIMTSGDVERLQSMLHDEAIQSQAFID